MTNISSVFVAGIEEVRKSWGWFLVFGILLMILGAACVGKAQTATTFSILALGWVLAISGVVWLVSSFYAWSWGGFFVYLLNAIIRGVTGYLLIRHPDAGAEGVTMLLAALFIVGGLFRAAGASVIQFPRWGWTVFAGLVSVALGVYLVATWSTSSTFFVGIAIGIDLIFDGAALIGFAGAIHSLPNVHAGAV
ncbi:MAG TPA: DUF308 domain-containing protein [Candidatus Methylomirabilis sp.]|nr:DUF308 domain-containing protein [Candidatus Methylomirabilis sp.]